MLEKQLDSYSYTDMDSPVGIQEVGARRIQDNRHMEVVKLPLLGTGRLYPEEIYLVHRYFRGSVDLRTIVWPEG